MSQQQRGNTDVVRAQMPQTLGLVNRSTVVSGHNRLRFSHLTVLKTADGRHRHLRPNHYPHSLGGTMIIGIAEP